MPRDALLAELSGSGSESSSDESQQEETKQPAKKNDLDFAALQRAGYDYQNTGAYKSFADTQKEEKEKREEEELRKAEAEDEKRREAWKEEDALQQQQAGFKRDADFREHGHNPNDPKRGKWAPRHGMDSCISRNKTSDKDRGSKKFDKANINTYEEMIKRGMFRKAENFLEEMYNKQ